jgi:hypothetical protein
LAAALQQQDGGSAMGNATMSDLADVANIQRLLQMQQQQQQQQQRTNPLLGLGRTNHSQLGSLLGLSSSTGTGISASLLAQLEGLGSGRNTGGHTPDQVSDNLSSILRQYGGSGGGGLDVGGGAGSQFYHHGSNSGDNTPVVSDAFALLQRAMQQRENGSKNNDHGFGSDR